MRRAFGLLFGAATQVLFLVTVRAIFQFLSGHEPRDSGGSQWTNALLALQFAVPHSLLLHPNVRQRLSPWIAPAFYGCFYCAATCASLLATIAFWQESSTVVLQFDGTDGMAVRSLYCVSWAALFYSLHLTGLGYQSGFTPWWDWVRRRPQRRREFVTSGAYRLLRHPIYLSFLGLVWFTPVVTQDRLILMAVWTPYILLGSWLKDRRLTHYLRDVYREYMARVPGYPGMPRGPLARVPFAPAAECDVPSTLRLPQPSSESARRRAA